MMHTKLSLKPGQRGTKKLLRKYGARLVRVRYRYDEARRKRYKTVELIVDEVPWEPAADPNETVSVSVAYEEFDLRRRVKAVGGRWNPEVRRWVLPRHVAEDLELEERIAPDEKHPI